MRDLINILMEGGKGGNSFRDADLTNEPGGIPVTMPQIVETVARELGWKRSEPVSRYSMLYRGKEARGRAFPRVFTKSNVEFVLYGLQSRYLLVAAKRCSSSWSQPALEIGDDNPNGVTYLKVIIQGRVDYAAIARQVRDFTQEYRRLHANSDGRGSGKRGGSTIRIS